MKKIIIWLLLLLAITANITVYGSASPQEENIAPQDSAVSVVGWFCKHDTVTYIIENRSWNLSDTDTVCSAMFAMKVRLNVTDSTANGYKMEYTMLECPTDIETDSMSAKAVFQNIIAKVLGETITGKTTRFETDEFGRITKYNNLGDIKKQAKSLSKEIIKTLSQFPEIKALKKAGVDINKYTKNISTEQMVDGYLEDLNMIFALHGTRIRLGESIEHQDATDTTYESTTITSASLNAEDGTYSIVYDVASFIPPAYIKSVVGRLVEAFSNDSITENFNQNFDTQVNEDCINDDYLKLDYLPNGWPYSVVRQKSSLIGGKGKIKQTAIYLDFYSFAQ